MRKSVMESLVEMISSISQKFIIDDIRKSTYNREM